MGSRGAGSLTLATGLLACTVLGLPATARSIHASGAAPGGAGGSRGILSWSVAASLGMAAGTAHERVYDGAYKLSQLDWELDGVGLAGAEGSVSVGRRVTISAGLWKAVTGSGGTMVDRDWIYAPYSFGDAVGFPPPPRIAEGDWTHESRHPDTTLDAGTVLDLNLAVRAVDLGPVSVSGLVGYLRDEWKWSARGGRLRYSVDRNGNGLLDQPDEFRNFEWQLPASELAIGYEQVYAAPYVGLACEGGGDAFRVAGYLRYSPRVSASDRDLHAQRDPPRTFAGSFSGGEMLGAGLRGTLQLDSGAFVSAALDLQRFSEVRGDVTISDDGRVVGTDRDGASAELGVASFLVSAGWRF